MNKLDELKKRLPFTFRDDKILENVFVHGSFLKERGGEGLSSNERLEFLGDAVLESIVSHILFERFPEKNEGELTRFRSRLVNGQVLSGLARALGLGEALRIGKGERAAGLAKSDAILANTFEALVAAVYLDGGGYAVAYAFVKGLMSEIIERGGVEDASHFDHKPALQELTQARYKVEPEYALVAEEGPPHRKLFTVEARVEGRHVGTGTAGRKKDAEQLAAREALQTLARGEDQGNEKKE